MTCNNNLDIDNIVFKIYLSLTIIIFIVINLFGSLYETVSDGLSVHKNLIILLILGITISFSIYIIYRWRIEREHIYSIYEFTTRTQQTVSFDDIGMNYVNNIYNNRKHIPNLNKIGLFMGHIFEEYDKFAWFIVLSLYNIILIIWLLTSSEYKQFILLIPIIILLIIYFPYELSSKYNTIEYRVVIIIITRTVMMYSLCLLPASQLLSLGNDDVTYSINTIAIFLLLSLIIDMLLTFILLAYFNWTSSQLYYYDIEPKDAQNDAQKKIENDRLLHILRGILLRLIILLIISLLMVGSLLLKVNNIQDGISIIITILIISIIFLELFKQIIEKKIDRNAPPNKTEENLREMINKINGIIFINNIIEKIENENKNDNKVPKVFWGGDNYQLVMDKPTDSKNNYATIADMLKRRDNKKILDPFRDNKRLDNGIRAEIEIINNKIKVTIGRRKGIPAHFQPEENDEPQQEQQPIQGHIQQENVDNGYLGDGLGGDKAIEQNPIWEKILQKQRDKELTTYHGEKSDIDSLWKNHSLHMSTVNNYSKSLFIHMNRSFRTIKSLDDRTYTLWEINQTYKVSMEFENQTYIYKIERKDHEREK